MTAEVVLELNDDGSLLGLAVALHLLALRIMKQNERSPTKLSERISPSDWLKKGTCLASSCGMEGQMCVTGHSLNALSDQHCQKCTEDSIYRTKMR